VSLVRCAVCGGGFAPAQIQSPQCPNCGSPLPVSGRAGQAYPQPSAPQGYPPGPASGNYPVAPTQGYPAPGPASGNYPVAQPQGYPVPGPASGNYPAAPPQGYPAPGPASGNYPVAPAQPGYPPAAYPAPRPDPRSSGRVPQQPPNARSSGRTPVVERTATGHSSRTGPPSASAFDSTRSGSRPTGSAGQGLAPEGGLPSEGEAFAHYQLVRKLGVGAFGVVWYGRDRRDGSEVALKILANVTAGSLERFQLEIKATATLDHPNIVPLRDYGEERDRPYLAMGYVNGRSLKEWRELDFEEAAEALRDVCYAVDYAHQNEVLHRDIKPDNIMLDQEGKAWILDFGLAQLGESEGLTKTGDMVGTPAYMAPEQAKGEGKRVDARCDVYSLGATLFYVLTGHSPFYKSQTIHAQLAAVLFEEPPDPSDLNEDVPEPLDWIVRKCLEKKPGRRYSSAAALAEDLDNYLSGTPVRARPKNKKRAAGKAKEARRQEPTTTNAKTIQLAAGAVVLIALVTAVLLVLRQPAEGPPASPESSLAAVTPSAPERSPRPSPSARPSATSAPGGRASLRNARTLFKSGQAEGALRAASQALSENAGLSEARDLRAQILASLGRWTEAADDLSLLIEDRRFDVGLRVRRGRAWLQLGKLKRAAEDLRIARTKKSTLEVLVLSGEIALTRKEPLVALQHLADAARMDADDLYLRRIRGQAYAANGDLDQAEGDLDFVVRRAPADGAAALALGTFYLDRQKTDLALETYENGLQSGAKHAPLALAAATLHEAGGHRDEALKRFKDALDWDPDSSQAAAAVSRLSGAAPAPRATPTPSPSDRPAAEVSPLLRDPSAWIPLLDEAWPPLSVYSKTYAQNWGRRLRECERAVREESQVATSWINLGRALAARDKHQKAVDAFRRALALEADSPQGLQGLGAALLQLGKPEEALDHLAASAEKHKHDPETWRLLGLAALRAKRGARYASKIEAVLPRFRSVIGLYQVLARCKVTQGQLAQAEDLIDRGLQKRSRSRELLLERALIRAKQGDPEAALEDLEKGAKLDFSKEFDPWLSRFRVRVLAAAGQHPEALRLAQSTRTREDEGEPRTLALIGLLHGLSGDPKQGAVDLEAAFREKARGEYLLLKGLLRHKAGEQVSSRLDLERFCREYSSHPQAAEIKRFLQGE
jgi:serine/threonine protein kinase/tetratricopeptide (TPR) repeat protein